MASSKLMTSSNSINSDQPSSPSSKSHFTTANFLPISDNSTFLNDQPSLADAVATPRTVDDVWREIVAGDNRECKEEISDEMMTLEDFLVKAGAVDDEEDGDDDVKMTIPLSETLSGSGMFSLDPNFQGIESVEGSVIGFGNGNGNGNGNGVEVVEGGGRGKRGRPVLEQLDKAAQQRQRRMIKNRESAARSRERKQAYQVELETLAVKLEEENYKLLKEKAERKKERLKQLMENVIPVVEQRRPPRLLRRVRSVQW